MQEATVFPADTKLKLPQRLQEDHRLDSTNSSTNFDEADIGGPGFSVDGLKGYTLDPVLDRVCYVRYNLHRLSQIIATTLALDNLLVCFARRDVVVPGQLDTQKTLVVTQV